MFLWCVRDERRQRQTALLTQLLLLTIARCVIFKNPLRTSSESWLVLLNRGHWGQHPSGSVLSLEAGSHSGRPGSNWLNGRRHLPILFHNAHLLPLLLPLIYTGASVIDSSVKDQYKTFLPLCICAVGVFYKPSRLTHWSMNIKLRKVKWVNTIKKPQSFSIFLRVIFIWYIPIFFHNYNRFINRFIRAMTIVHEVFNNLL